MFLAQLTQYFLGIDEQTFNRCVGDICDTEQLYEELKTNDRIMFSLHSSQMSVQMSVINVAGRIDPEARTSFTLASLISSGLYDHPVFLKKLVQGTGMDINKSLCQPKNPDGSGFQLLHLAIQKSSLDTIKMLVEELGADINLLGDETPGLPQHCALTLAAEHLSDKPAVLDYLLNRPQLKITDALYYAALHENKDLANLLLEKSASKNDLGAIFMALGMKDDLTADRALRMAVLNQKFSLITPLLGYGARPDHASPTGKTAMQLLNALTTDDTKKQKYASIFKFVSTIPHQRQSAFEEKSLEPTPEETAQDAAVAPSETVAVASPAPSAPAHAAGQAEPPSADMPTASLATTRTDSAPRAQSSPLSLTAGKA